jgi:hypothetical protein
MLPALPKAKELLGDTGYDAGWFRDALSERGISACISSKSNRKVPIEYDRTLYRKRHKIENVFARLSLLQPCANWPTGDFDDSVSGGDSEALSCQANLLWWPVPSIG